MPDVYAKVQPGDEVTFNSQAWNAAVEAGRQSKLARLNVLAPVPSFTTSSTIIRVLNSTGVDLPRNSVVGLGDPIFTPDDTSLDAFMQEITFRVFKPDINKHKRKYAVLLDPAPIDRVVRAYISGACQVQVNQRDEAHEYAIIGDNQYTCLDSSRHGHAHILWREGLQGSGYGYYDMGIQWAIVMLGVTGSSGAIGRTNGPITAFTEGSHYGGYEDGTYGTGFVDLYRNQGGRADGPLETIPVLNPGAAISAEKWVAVEWDADDDAYVGPLECESPGPYG